MNNYKIRLIAVNKKSNSADVLGSDGVCNDDYLFDDGASIEIAKKLFLEGTSKSNNWYFKTEVVENTLNSYMWR